MEMPNLRGLDVADKSIMCKCGETILLNEHLYQLWKERGIKFKCSCGSWVEWEQPCQT